MIEKEAKLIIATFGIDKSFEIQTDETPARLVAAVFWSELSARRLRESEAQEYALLFAASPALLAACEYCHNLLCNGVGQATHAVVMLEDVFQKAKKGA
jgi:hypothetical protein